MKKLLLFICGFVTEIVTTILIAMLIRQPINPTLVFQGLHCSLKKGSA